MTSIAAIIAHYQGTQTDEQLLTCVGDILPQIGDGSIHVLHDGPLHRPWPALSGVYLHGTPERKNAWGHNLRRLGLLWCDAEYVWFTNADNRLYAGALDKVRAKMPFDVVLFSIKDFFVKGDPNKHRDLLVDRDNGRDCMQAIATKEIWSTLGAWKNTDETADAPLIRNMESIFTVQRIDEFLGEHW